MTISNKDALITVLVVSIFIPFFAFAFSAMPFGGRITTVKTPPTVQCGTGISSPFWIVPVTGTAGPWSALPGPVNVGQIVPNAWILGLIMPGTGSCMTTTPPPVLFPTTTTNFYGTSIGF